MEIKLILGLIVMMLSVSVGTFGLWGLFRMPYIKNWSVSMIGIIFFMLVAGAISFLLCCEFLMPYLAKGHPKFVGDYQSSIAIVIVVVIGVWIGRKSWSWMTKKP